MTGPQQDAPVILVVEDEPLIRMEAVDMIEEAGFRTFEAASAAQALQVLEQEGEIAVLFTDVDMPGGMNGLALAAEVRDRFPEMGIIIASGIVDLEGREMPPGCRFFPKPYPTSRITAALREVTGQG